MRRSGAPFSFFRRPTVLVSRSLEITCGKELLRTLKSRLKLYHLISFKEKSKKMDENQ